MEIFDQEEGSYRFKRGMSERTAKNVEEYHQNRADAKEHYLVESDKMGFDVPAPMQQSGMERDGASARAPSDESSSAASSRTSLSERVRARLLPNTSAPIVANKDDKEEDEDEEEDDGDQYRSVVPVKGTQGRLRSSTVDRGRSEGPKPDARSTTHRTR